ncbi:MAG TPA: glycosyltransferase 87 family protein [Candidatus Limnocylindria bacterium]|nr:glycosyltransferase 87 family protein [Candidatus Limnocylindria bacterium]
MATASPGRRFRLLAIGSGAALAAIAALAILELPAVAYRHNDFAQYYAGARAVAAGGSPYGDAFWSILDSLGSRALFASAYGTVSKTGLTTPYPLWVFVVLIPIGVLPFAAAAAAFLVAQVAALSFALGALARRLFVAIPRRETVLFLAIALAFQPVWLLVVGGNIAALVTAAFGGAFAAALAGRARLAGALLGACLVKPQVVALAAVVLLIALDAASRRRALVALAVVGGALGASAFAADASWFPDWWRNVVALQATTGSNASGWTIDRAFGGPRWTGPLAVSLAVAAFLGWWLLRRPRLPALTAAALPVSIFAAPHAWSYDASALLATIAVVLAGMQHLSNARRIAWLAALAVIAVALPWAAYAVAFRRAGEEWTALVVLLFFPLVALAERARPRPNDRSGASAP